MGYSDWEKVIKGLQELSEHLFHEYQVCYRGDAEDFYNWFLKADAALELLKEQEPIEPVQRSDGTFCGWCGTVLPATFMCLDGQVKGIRNDYCICCGRAVKCE